MSLFISRSAPSLSCWWTQRRPSADFSDRPDVKSASKTPRNWPLCGNGFSILKFSSSRRDRVPHGVHAESRRDPVWKISNFFFLYPFQCFLLLLLRVDLIDRYRQVELIDVTRSLCRLDKFVSIIRNGDVSRKLGDAFLFFLFKIYQMRVVEYITRAYKDFAICS